MLTILQGDALEQLQTLPDQSIQCCVTSPPYWGLRDYKCQGQLGLEKTPEQYVTKIVHVFSEVRRVLKDDGTLWLNLGDSYFGDSPARKASGEAFSKTWDKSQTASRGGNRRSAAKLGDLKPKDLVGIPWMVAFALRSDGWYLRSDIIWHKPNVMPESVTDRPTKAHEYLFLLSKQPHYYYDQDAIKEPASESDWENRAGRGRLNNGTMFKDPALYDGKNNGRVKRSPNYKDKQRGHIRHHDGGTKAEQCSGMRNKRDVWTVSPANYPEAHFATFPPNLIKPCILAGSRPNDIILDPFAGSGTTGQVALELGRKIILIELNPAYIPLINQRCHVTTGLPLCTR